MKMVNKFYRKHKEKLAKGTTSFLKKKKKKTKESPIQVSKFFWRGKRKWRKYHRGRNKNPSGEEKEKKNEYMKNYYSAHEKYLLSWFVDFWSPGAIQNKFFMVANISRPMIFFSFLNFRNILNFLFAPDNPISHSLYCSVLFLLYFAVWLWYFVALSLILSVVALKHVLLIFCCMLELPVSFIKITSFELFCVFTPKPCFNFSWWWTLFTSVLWEIKVDVHEFWERKSLIECFNWQFSHQSSCHYAYWIGFV